MSISTLFSQNEFDLNCRTLSARTLQTDSLQVEGPVTLDSLIVTGDVTTDSLNVTNDIACENVTTNTLEVLGLATMGSLTTTGLATVGSLTTIGALTTTNTMTAANINVTEISYPTCLIYHPNGSSTGRSFTFKYSINGVCNIYYDGQVPATNFISDRFFQLGIAGNFNLTGLPNPRGVDGSIYRYPIFLTKYDNPGADNPEQFLACLVLTKISSTQISFQFRRTTDTDFVDNLFGIEPFQISYPLF